MSDWSICNYSEAGLSNSTKLICPTNLWNWVGHPLLSLDNTNWGKTNCHAYPKKSHVKRGKTLVRTMSYPKICQQTYFIIPLAHRLLEWSLHGLLREGTMINFLKHVFITSVDLEWIMHMGNEVIKWITQNYM